ncbi:MAG: hypothetical protein J0L57_21595 [Burkholderiales bacterium]|nr:hypothetical protein [Burkholderiales bacterium]
MGKERGGALARLPEHLHPEQRLTAAQAMQLSGRGRSRFYEDVKRGALPQPERDGPRFVRWRAGTLIEALNRGSRP